MKPGMHFAYLQLMNISVSKIPAYNILKQVLHLAPMSDDSLGNKLFTSIFFHLGKRKPHLLLTVKIVTIINN
jgi:hypothetical protein